MIEAFADTLALARSKQYDHVSFDAVGVDYFHLVSMLQRMKEGNFSGAEQGLWLGYAQGVLVANECGTLEDFKEINQRYADDFTHRHLKRGTKYKVVGQVRIQASVFEIKDNDILTLYVDEDGAYSGRHPAEFADGRFERIQAPETGTDVPKME